MIVFDIGDFNQYDLAFLLNEQKHAVPQIKFDMHFVSLDVRPSSQDQKLSSEKEFWGNVALISMARLQRTIN